MIVLGCGYIGTALARAELAAGRRVGAVTRNVAQAEELRGLGVDPVVVADLASDAWHEALDPVGEAVVNCVSPAGGGAEGYRHSFIEGTASLTRWLEKSATAGRMPAREVLFTSSTSVYPQTDGGWVEEDTRVEAAELGPAGTWLREAENLVLGLPMRLVKRRWVLRLGGLYGPGRHHLLDALRAGQTTFAGGGGHWVNLLHQEDAVQAICACLAAGAGVPGGIFNAVDDEPVIKRDLVAWIARRLGQDTNGLSFNTEEPGRSHHRQNAGAVAPHRRVSNQRLRDGLKWRPKYPSYREGYDKIMG